MEDEKEKLLEEIGELAASYTPEWHFDRENPDAGTALALLWAEMFLGVRARFHRIPEKHRRVFFEQLGLTVKPESPAEGYVSFGLSGDEFGGVYLPKDVELSMGSVDYRTKEAVYVTPARPVLALFVDGEKDYVARKNLGGFCPFSHEEENLREHCFYLCGEEVFDVAGRAELFLSAPDLAAHAGDCEFSYGTEEGFAEFAGVRAEEGRLVLVRGEGQEPIARRELFGRQGYWICCRYEKPWLFEPLAVDQISLSSRRGGVEPDLVWNLEGEQENREFFPFGRQPAPFAECYFASREALGKAGATVTLSFSLDYERIPFDNSVPVDRRWKLIMRRSDFAPDPEYDITVESVVWEYYNGAGWSRLPLGGWERLFDGSGGGEEISLAFPCPDDAGLLEWQAAPTRYLRVRILRMNNLYKPKGAYLAPVLGHVRFGYDCGEKGVQPELVVSVNNGEERKLVPGRKNGQIPLFWGQGEKRAALYLGFPMPLAGEPLRFLFSMEEDVGGEPVHLDFAVSGAKGFLPLSAADQTAGLLNSGTLTLEGSGEHRKATVCGESLYWLRIADGQGIYRKKGQGMARICAIWPNAVRAVAEEGSGGSRGNCAPHAVTRIGGSYGLVSSVTNPLPFSGGEDEETLDAALLRGSRALFHRGRAITAADYEALALEASGCVERVRCVPNCNEQGEHSPGSVALVLLLKGFDAGPVYFDRERERIFDYVTARMGTNPAALGRLHVVKPLFLEVDCEVEAVVKGQGYEVQDAIREAHRRFLDPIAGNYDGRGWEIGAWPTEVQVTNALRKVPGLLYIRALRLRVFRREDGRRRQLAVGGRDWDFDKEQALSLARRFAVVLPGTCRVTTDTE